MTDNDKTSLTVSISAFVSSDNAFSTTMISGCMIAIFIVISPAAAVGVAASRPPPPDVFYPQQHICRQNIFFTVTPDVLCVKCKLTLVNT